MILLARAWWGRWGAWGYAERPAGLAWAVCCEALWLLRTGQGEHYDAVRLASAPELWHNYRTIPDAKSYGSSKVSPRFLYACYAWSLQEDARTMADAASWHFGDYRLCAGCRLMYQDA